jgi:phage repressor protein C with HTH and peptisase S24 domain
MARRKNLPELVRVKCQLSERLRDVRTELFGERGGSEMARRLGLPIRTWYNYEAGVTIPAEVLLKFVELTSVEPLWLLHGRGAKFRTSPPASIGDPAATVESLLRTALKHLERKGESAGRFIAREPLRTESLNGPASAAGNAHDPHHGHQRWVLDAVDDLSIRVEGDSMAPIIAEGAQVSYTADDEPPSALEGKLVVAWIEGQPIVRWFRQSGRYGLLRAENPEHQPSILLLDLDGPPADRKVRRVLWISTPH